MTLHLFLANYIYKPALMTVANKGTINSTAVTYTEFADDIVAGDLIVRFLSM